MITSSFTIMVEKKLMFKLGKRNILTKTNLNIRKVNYQHSNFIQMAEKSKGLIMVV